MRLFCLIFFALALAVPAFAWNKPGHMVTGALAYDALVKDDPALAKSLADVLRQSGLFDSKIKDVPTAEQDRVLFIFAARWPDDVRMNPTYNRSKWHYYDTPFVPPGDQTKPADPDHDNAIKALEHNLEILSFSTEARTKAIALAWVIHISGDLHQPLHAVSEYSTTYPEGDRGGNSQFVRAEAGRAVLNLHSVWDGLILGSNSERDASNVALKLEQRPEFDRAKLVEAKDLDPLHWADESFKLAVRDAYLNGKLKTSNDKHDGVVLPDGYLTTAKADAERRMMLAGYRIAAELQSIGKKPAAGPATEPATIDAKQPNDGSERETDQDPPEVVTPPVVAPPTPPVKRPATPPARKSVIVHVTKSGKKYHTANCPELGKSDLTMTLADAKAKGLEPCSKCHPPQ